MIKIMNNGFSNEECRRIARLMCVLSMEVLTKIIEREGLEKIVNKVKIFVIKEIYKFVGSCSSFIGN